MYNLTNTDIRKFFSQTLIMLTIMTSSYMSWRTLGWVFNNESPVVVVMGESMCSTFSRGDLLFQHLNSSPIDIGEVVVFKLPSRSIPIVHRVLKLHIDAQTGDEFILTKGDSNPINDRGIYDQGQLWLERKHIIGRIKGHLPYIGMIPVLLNDYPKLKQTILVILGFSLSLGLIFNQIGPFQINYILVSFLFIQMAL